MDKTCSNCLQPLTYLIDMRPSNAGLIGKRGSLSELMTPALVLDLDAFEQNISAYQQLINAHGLKARPHAKSTSALRSHAARSPQAASASRPPLSMKPRPWPKRESPTSSSPHR